MISIPFKKNNNNNDTNSKRRPIANQILNLNLYSIPP